METEIGKVIHYYDRISVAVLRLTDSLRVGDEISIQSNAGVRLEQKVDSMQVDHQGVTQCKKGEEVAIKVSGKVKEGDIVYKK